MERRAAEVVLCVDVGAVVEEEAYGGEAATFYGAVEDSGLEAVAGGWVGS